MSEGNERWTVPPHRFGATIVVGVVGTFVVCGSAGMENMTVAAIGIALVACAVGIYVISAVNSRTFAYVPGSGHVVWASDPPSAMSLGRCNMRLVVTAKGIDSVAVKVRDPKVPVAKWPDAGADLPILVAANDPRRVLVQWDDIAAHGTPRVAQVIPTGAPIVVSDMDGSGIGDAPTAVVVESIGDETVGVAPIAVDPSDTEATSTDPDFTNPDQATYVAAVARVATADPVDVETRTADDTVARDPVTHDPVVENAVVENAVVEDAVVEDAVVEDAVVEDVADTTSDEVAEAAVAETAVAEAAVAEAAVAEASRVDRPMSGPMSGPKLVGPVRVEPIDGAAIDAADGDIAATEPTGPRSGADADVQDAYRSAFRPAADEPPHGDPGNGTPVNSKPADAEPADAKPADATPVNSEPVEGEPGDDEDPHRAVDVTEKDGRRMIELDVRDVRWSPAAGTKAEPGSDRQARSGSRTGAGPLPHRRPSPRPRMSSDPATAVPTNAVPAAAPAAAGPTAAGPTTTGPTAGGAADETIVRLSFDDLPVDEHPTVPLQVSQARVVSPAVTAVADGSPDEVFDQAGPLSDAYIAATPPPGVAANQVRSVAVTLFVTDLSRSIKFYRDTLGFAESDAGRGSAVLVSGDARIVLRRVAMAPVDRRLVQLLLEVPDVDAAYAELRERDVRFLHRPRPVGQYEQLTLWAAALRDPDGHGIAITQWRPA